MRPANCGETRFTAGKSTPPRTIRGGSRGCATCSIGSTLSGLITFEVLKRTGRYPLARRPRQPAAGYPARAPNSSRRCARRLGSLPVIAEDLGLITPGVEALRDEFDLPGMRVLQFGFGPDAGAEKYLPHQFVPHCCVYTGTHDNDTARGWFTSTEIATTQSSEDVRAERAFALRYANSTGDQIHWDMIRLAFASVADTAVIPLQDILGLDSRARMNFPGKADGNWRWRFQKDQIDLHAQEQLAELTAVYSRWNGAVPTRLDPRFRPPKPDRVTAADPLVTKTTHTGP